MRVLTTFGGLLLLVLLAAGRPVLAADDDDGLGAWPALAAAKQRAHEQVLLAVPNADRLRALHDDLCSESHPAGTPADERMILKLVAAFEALGLETRREDFFAWLPHFVQARVDVIDGDQVVRLPVVERPIAQDPQIATVVPHAFNAYSATGDVVAPPVYANYGTKEDFARLVELGVPIKGRVVVARYGRNFRGFKAKYAEAHGAVGALLYTDPQDSGWGQGLPYPEGGYADPYCIQRGSILTLAYPGDPLTPFEPATKDAKRLDPHAIGLPRIPVQPIGWQAAHAILSRMTGAEVPEGWQGGLPFRYRVDGPDTLRVHLQVEQPCRITPSANVIGVVPGATHPDELVIVGCHFDAWTFGSGDPQAGTIVMFEMARSFVEAARAGHRPARTVVFANWGAEEYGIIGSTEWVEAHRAQLTEHGVAYINLDMAAMGPNFGSSAAPALKRVIEDAARAVPQARQPDVTVHTRWTASKTRAAHFGNLGGGSDHVGFYCHLGIPSCSLGAGGSRGVSYHTAYETLAWYRKIVGDDYEPALMLARLGSVLVARLANAPLLPLDLARPFADMADHLEGLMPVDAGGPARFAALQARVLRMAESAAALQERWAALVAGEGVDPAILAAANGLLRGAERAWLHAPGLRARPWYRSLYAAPDPHSGYAAWMLPHLRMAVESGDAVAITTAERDYVAALDAHERALSALRALLPPEDGAPR
ncbi:MAG: M28 family peptidase [Planctomycetota bacterium]|nr:M28 family peptidase [Planctomycetota bacterium]